MQSANVTPSTEPLNFSQPRISYTSAMRASFVWRDELHTVGTCPLSILTEFIVHYAVCARLPAHQLKEVVECLDYQDIGRWQALDTLLTFGVVLPLERVT